MRYIRTRFNLKSVSNSHIDWELPNMGEGRKDERQSFFLKLCYIYLTHCAQKEIEKKNKGGK